jgi:hypothetical protein
MWAKEEITKVRVHVSTNHERTTMKAEETRKKVARFQTLLPAEKKFWPIPLPHYSIFYIIYDHVWPLL